MPVWQLAPVSFIRYAFSTAQLIYRHILFCFIFNLSPVPSTSIICSFLLRSSLCTHCEMKQKCPHCAWGPNICTQSTNHMVLISANPRFLWFLEHQCWRSVAKTPLNPSSGFWDMISIPPSLYSNSAIRTASVFSGELSSRQILLHLPEYLFLHTDTNIALPVFMKRQVHHIAAATDKQ